MRLILNFIFLLMCLCAQAQIKIEKETKVAKLNVPNQAKIFLDSLNLLESAKWYKEQGIDQITYEAKSKIKGKRVSVEFSDSGEFEDLELEIKVSEMEKSLMKAVHQILAKDFEKFKIEKIQVQVKGSAAEINSFLSNSKLKHSASFNYEIVISTKSNKQFETYEYLFNSEGEVLKKFKLKESMDDNLVY